MTIGRPKKEIDAELVKRLAHIQCTHAEIGAVVGVSETTIKRRFGGRIAVWREGGKRSLRRLQWKRAREGSDKMLIHLGKQYLGQTDKVEQTVEQRGKIGVMFDGDFYGNATRLRTTAVAPSGDGSDGRGQKQGSCVRPSLGKDGDGSDGDGAGPRSS